MVLFIFEILFNFQVIDLFSVSKKRLFDFYNHKFSCIHLFPSIRAVNIIELCSPLFSYLPMTV